MYGAVEELTRNSGTERCTFSRFTSPSSLNLFTAIQDQLRLYLIVQDDDVVTLKLIWEEKLFGHVVDLVSIAGDPDLVLVSLKDAKAVLLKWSSVQQQPIIVSMHYFERDTLQSEFLVNHYEPRLALEPSGRCAAMRVYKDNIAFIPILEDAPMVEEEIYSSFASSFVVSLATMNKRIKNLITFAFLPGYVQPTLALLYEPELTFVGRYALKKDSCELAVVSIDPVQKIYTTLFGVEHLPTGCCSLIPLDKPVGGLLIVSPDGIMHMDQGYSGYSIAVNSFSTRSNATNFRYKKNSTSLELDLSQAQMIPISPFQVICFLANGTTFLLTLMQEGRRFITGMELKKIDYNGPSFIPMFLCRWEKWIFVGSRLSDSCLIRCVEGEANDAKVSKMHTSHSIDDVDAELFGAAPVAHAHRLDYSLVSVLVIPTYGPIRDAAIAPSNNQGASSGKFIVAVGKDACGAVCLLDDCVKPIVTVSFSFPECCNIWSFPCPDSPFDKYLMLSTANSTLIMELKDDEFNELPVSDFYLEGVTLYASTIANHSLVLQVYRAGFRLVSNDSNIKLVYSYEIENVFQIKSAAILKDRYLFVLFENGYVRAFSIELDMNAAHQIAQVDCNPIFASMGEIGCIACLSYDAASIVCCYTMTGRLYIYDVERNEVLFEDDEFYLLPMISHSNISQVMVVSSVEHENVIEMCLVRINSSDELYLLLKDEYSHTVSYKVCLDTKVLVKQKASFYRNCESAFSPGNNSIVPLRLLDKSTLQSAVVSFGKNSSCLWSVSSESMYPRIHNFLPANKTMLCVTSHHSTLAKDGMIFITNDGFLNIAQLDSTFNYNNGWIVKKIVIGKDVCFADYNLNSNKCILAVGTKTLFTVPPVEGTAPAETEAKTESMEVKQPADAKFLPHFDEFAIELYSTTLFEKIDSYQLKQYEIVTGCRSTVLNSRQASSGRKEFLIVSSSYLKGEDRQIRGRFLLFDVISIVPDPRYPHRTHKLKFILSAEQKGPVTAFSQVNGYLLVSVGTKVMMFSFDQNDDEAMEAIAFLDVSIYSTSIASLKNYFLVGDVYRSGMFCVWQEEPPKLILLGQDGHKLSTVCVEFMIQNQSLFLVVSDAFGTIHTFAYSPNSLSSSGGTKLVKKSHFHVGTRVIKFLRFSLSDTVQGLYYFGQDGSIGVIFPMQEKMFKRVHGIFARYLTAARMPLGLNARAHRLDLQNESSALVTNLVTRSVLDCELIDHFCSEDDQVQREVVHYIGASLSKTFADFEEIFSSFTKH